jgi:NADPH:quinone reductase-like Zn-dependent oxidoreductase
MKAYEVNAGQGIETLRLIERAAGVLGPREVRVKLAAAALNYRDLMIVDGQYLPQGEWRVLDAPDSRTQRSKRSD